MRNFTSGWKLLPMALVLVAPTALAAPRQDPFVKNAKAFVTAKIRESLPTSIRGQYKIETTIPIDNQPSTSTALAGEGRILVVNARMQKKAANVAPAPIQQQGFRAKLRAGTSKFIARLKSQFNRNTNRNYLVQLDAQNNVIFHQPLGSQTAVGKAKHFIQEHVAPEVLIHDILNSGTVRRTIIPGILGTAGGFAISPGLGGLAAGTALAAMSAGVAKRSKARHTALESTVEMALKGQPNGGALPSLANLYDQYEFQLNRESASLTGKTSAKPWSMETFVKKFNQVYQAKRAGLPTNMPEPAAMEAMEMAAPAGEP